MFHDPDIKSRQAFALTTLELRVLTKSAYSNLVYSGAISLNYALLQSGARSKNGGMQRVARVFLFVVGHSFDSVVFRQAFLPFPVASPLTDRDATVHQFPNLSMTADIHSSPYVYWIHSITDNTVAAAGDYITTLGPCSRKVVPSQKNFGRERAR